MTEHQPPFVLTDVATVVQKRFKTIAGFVVLVVALATAVVFILPKYYAASVTAIAANPALADKARLFNNNIEGLYSSFGSSDDLDRLYGIAQLDTVYATLVDRFHLVGYYKAKGTTPAKARRSAILQLQKDVQLEKNELYQLKITVWNKDPEQAAAIANTMMKLVEQKLETIWQNGYHTALQQFDSAIGRLQQRYVALGQRAATPKSDSILNNPALAMSERNAIPEQLNAYRKLQNEFEIAAASKTPALMVLEQATAPAKPLKPRKWAIILAAFLLSTCFGIIVALVHDRKAYAYHE